MLFFRALKKNIYIYIYKHQLLSLERNFSILTYEHKMEIHKSKPIYDGFLKDYPTILLIHYLDHCKL